jgi:hypothetical protein
MLGWARSRTDRGFSIVAALAGTVAALTLGGCSGSMIADHLPSAVGGLPEGVPDRPPEQAYPAVHNMPPQRTTTTLSEAQRKQLQDDLVAVRDRTATDAPSTTGTTGNSSAAAAKKP